jgi:hypothetical protein
MNLLLGVVFAWDALTGDIQPPVKGYKLFYGNTPDAMVYSIECGNVTTYNLADYSLAGSDTWYFICKAHDGAKLSKPSNQVIVMAKPSPSPTPSPTATPTATPGVKRTLTVYSGSGDGSYAVGTKVTVTADPSPELFQFFEWIGDVNLLADPKKESTTLTIPDTNCSILATYKRKL